MKQIVRTFTLFTAALMLSTSAFASTFLQFTEFGGFNAPFVLTANGAGTATTLTATKTVTAVFDPSFCLTVACGGAVNGGVYNLTMNAASTGPATLAGGIVTEHFGGTLTITQGAVNLLSINFSDTLSGALGGSNPVLQSSQPPDTFFGTSTVFDPAKLNLPRGFALSFSALSGGGLGLFGNTIRSGVADATGTFNATAAVPEPGTMVLLGSGLALIGRRLRKR